MPPPAEPQRSSEPPAHEAPAPDSGKALERTRLAWRRTTLAVTATAILLARLGLLDRAGFVIAIGALLWALLLTFIQRRIHVLTDPPRLRFRLLALTTAGCLGFAVLGVVAVLR